jgi:hypothetical protein
MSDIQRFKATLTMGPDQLATDTDGNFIKYKDHLKAMEAKSKVISKQKKAICVQKSRIETQAAEIERLKKEIEFLHQDRHDRIQRDWDNYKPSPRTMG